jgi:protein disulfide-isomerase A6
MKPAWDKLGDEYTASSSVVIGDADCTAEAESLCSKLGIEGYPAIKYFKAVFNGYEDYQGGRDFDSLDAFVKETLEEKCDVSNPVGCSDKEKGYIEKMAAKDSTERQKQISRLEKMADGSMAADLKAWLRQRLHVLRSLEAKEEL